MDITTQPGTTSTPLSKDLLDDLTQQANLEALALTKEEFAHALHRQAQKHNYNQPPNQTPTEDQKEHFYRSLQLPDLALAQACALGRNPAWQIFLTRFQNPLRQAAIAITGSSGLGEDLADSLYADLFGLSTNDAGRKSPLASYSGRGSLMGWLRSTLAQRHVDHHRRTWREEPLPEPNSDYNNAGPELAATQQAEAPEPAALTRLTHAVHRTLQTLDPDARFLLSAYFLDQQTLQSIARLLHVHEATISRKLKRLTTEVHKQLLKNLQADGLSRRAAEETLALDPRDLTLNLRSILQTSQPSPFLSKKESPPSRLRTAAEPSTQSQAIP